MPIILVFILVASVFVGISSTPAGKSSLGERPISAPTAMELPTGFENPTFPASLTVNGSIAYNNKFSTDPYVDLHFPILLTYDLHATHWLGRVDLFNNGPGNSLRQLRILASENGESWVSTGAVATLRDQPYWERMVFPEVKARWVRLEIWSIHGVLPEFRQIAFFPARGRTQTLQIPAAKEEEIPPGIEEGAFLVNTISPDLGREQVQAAITRQSGFPCFTELSNILIRPRAMPEGRYVFTFLFHEPQAISRTMRFISPGHSDEFFEVPSSNHSYKSFPVVIRKGSLSNFYSLETVTGPDVFFSMLWIHQQMEHIVMERRSHILESWPLMPANFADLYTNASLQADSDRLRQNGVTLFQDGNSWFLDFRVPEGEMAGSHPRFNSLELFFHDSPDRKMGFDLETLHLSISAQDRGDGKPMVSSVPHPGGSISVAISNLLDDPRKPGFDGRIHGGRYLLKWPRFSGTRSIGALMNLYTLAANREDSWFFASRSASPLDWAAVRSYTSRETGLWVTNRMIPGLSYDLTVRDPFTQAPMLWFLPRNTAGFAN